jgi:hypothetical protein
MPRLSYKSCLPQLLDRKIYKTGQTRGAELDEIYQNRVSRNSTVLIPLRLWMKFWEDGLKTDPDEGYENGSIFIISAADYFNGMNEKLPEGVQLGRNALVFYRTRKEWDAYNPKKHGWKSANSRQAPLGGQYIARVVATTREGDAQIFEGFVDSKSGGTGAGIRVYEYCPTKMLELTRYQLAYLAWQTEGMIDLCAKENEKKDIDAAIKHVNEFCAKNKLADRGLLDQHRLTSGGHTICPLCLKPIKAEELVSRVSQAEGREVVDLTITSANLFHIEELRPGVFNHRIYNLGWGHHHCNAVARDAGIAPTIAWMVEVLERNGYNITNPAAAVGGSFKELR